jgi:hypothetical protein
MEGGGRRLPLVHPIHPSPEILGVEAELFFPLIFLPRFHVGGSHEVIFFASGGNQEGRASGK